jgi:23S rRNA (adenine2503-C2)-methyltransferase
MKTDILGLDLKGLENAAESIGEQPFRGRQIANWLYKHKVRDFMEMGNIATPLRSRLAENFVIGKLKAVETLRDRAGTRKTLWELKDGLHIESVLIPDEGRLTLCISSQVGCPLECGFCATGQIGFKRNLTSGEMVNQYLQSELEAGERISNIVFMGMGEPLLNFDNLSTALKIFTDDLAIGFGAKKITVSTVGIPPKIRALANLRLKVGLAFSLNAADDRLRSRLMPVNRKYDLGSNLEALKYYQKKIDRRITFEYVLIKGVNDSLKDARKLAGLIHDIPCKINLIPYNPVEGSDLSDKPQFMPPDRKMIDAFRDYLYPRAPAVTLRDSKGASIAAACGQLKARYEKRVKD